MANANWYHGGDFINGKAKGAYLDVTDNPQYAKAHADDHPPNGTVYRLRLEFHHLVADHPNGEGTESNPSNRSKTSWWSTFRF
jgi:hypothetical protein